MTEPAWLSYARRQLGTREAPGPANEGRIMAMATRAKKWLGLCGVLISNGRIDGPVRVPFQSIDAVVKRHGFDEIYFSRLRHAYPVAVKLIKNCCSLVSLLNFDRHPATVLRGIGAIVVYPIKRVTCRPHPHIANESSKTFPPALANEYPPCTVVGELFSVPRVAPAVHIVPSPLFGTRGKSVRPVNYLRPFAGFFSSAATTTLRFSRL